MRSRILLQEPHIIHLIHPSEVVSSGPSKSQWEGDISAQIDLMDLTHRFFFFCIFCKLMRISIRSKEALLFGSVYNHRICPTMSDQCPNGPAPKFPVEDRGVWEPTAVQSPVGHCGNIARLLCRFLYLQILI
ncbi:hypothetical protein RRG08_065189 [Elysia crispata]|uniref:Uncharacterized protein n=1 Tax=Elysia crispata TaxID=231223 RepID=A0AAE0XPV2_9GAST|nr:hypothetical protein RRG08_065189 [Elysia crispata]